MFQLYLISIFLLNFPPLQIFGFNIQYLFSILSLSVFLIIIYNNFSSNQKITIAVKFKEKVLESTLLLLFIIAVSISSLQAIDHSLFISKYLSLMLSIILYINITFFGTKINKYIYAIFSTWVIANLANDLFILINPNLYLSLIPNFLTNRETMIIKDEIFRNRLTISTYIEVFLPFLFWFYFTAKKNKFLSYMQIFFIYFIAFYSGWRTRSITCIMSLLTVIQIYRVNIKKTNFYLNLLFLITPFILLILINMNYAINNSAINRLFSVDEEVMGANKSRVAIMKESWDIFNTAPIFGVGLGNNYIYRKNAKRDINPNRTVSSKLVRESGSHNIFVDLALDTGLIGIISFLAMLGLWLYEDKKNIKITSNYPFILSYYLIIFYGLFQSIGGYRFFSILFLLRTIIKDKENKNII